MPGQAIAPRSRDDAQSGELNSTQYRLHVNPQPGQPKPQFASLDWPRRSDALWRGHRALARGQGGYTLDEVRIGTTFRGGHTYGHIDVRSDFDLNGVRALQFGHLRIPFRMVRIELQRRL